LVVDPSKRMTPEQLLETPWVLGQSKIKSKQNVLD
jgi:hypothetical protein